MSRSHDLERRLADFYAAEAPSRAPDRVLGSALETIETTTQRRAWWSARRMPEMPNAFRLVIGATAVVVALVVGLSLLGGGRTPSVGTASPSPSAGPSSQLPAPTTASIGWTGPLRPDAATMSVIDSFADADARDAAMPWIDIVSVSAGGDGQPRRWNLRIAGAPPPASALDPTQRVIEYGVVLDKGGDGVADCVIGINNDAPKPGHFRVWVTDLSTGTKEEQVGPPYGYPIDFTHPDEPSGPELLGPERDMIFFFLGGSPQCSSVGAPLHYYAWASVTDAGRVTGWDYAPDDGWLAPPWPVTDP